MLDTKLGLVIIYAGSMCIFSIWNMKGYFDTIPIEIEEASKIDGASDFQLLWKVVMPAGSSGNHCNFCDGTYFCME